LIRVAISGCCHQIAAGRRLAGHDDCNRFATLEKAVRGDLRRRERLLLGHQTPARPPGKRLTTARRVDETQETSGASSETVTGKAFPGVAFILLKALRNSAALSGGRLRVITFVSNAAAGVSLLSLIS
jgi:hypothetical protein